MSNQFWIGFTAGALALVVGMAAGVVVWIGIIDFHNWLIRRRER